MKNKKPTILQKTLDERFEQFDQEMDMKFETWGSIIKEDFRKDIRETRDEIMTGQDKIVKELQDMREENAAGILQTRRVESTLEDHEDRIKTLEHRKN